MISQSLNGFIESHARAQSLPWGGGSENSLPVGENGDADEELKWNSRSVIPRHAVQWRSLCLRSLRPIKETRRTLGHVTYWTGSPRIHPVSPSLLLLTSARAGAWVSSRFPRSLKRIFISDCVSCLWLPCHESHPCPLSNPKTWLTSDVGIAGMMKPSKRESVFPLPSAETGLELDLKPLARVVPLSS